MSAVSTPSLSPCDSLEGATIRKQFKLPKELDILPPRPVLFPWLPSFDDIDCCGASKRKRNTASSQKFSFDWNSGSADGKTFGTQKVASEAGTPVTVPLSPNNEDDEEDAIPDMSRLDQHESQRHDPKQQQKQQNQPQPQLHSLADVIAEVLKVIFFMIHMRNRLLRQTSEEERRKAAYAASLAKSKRDERNASTNSLVDLV
eukprot:CAMPEP_0116135200 /NCGR_PEP_ID=MMETSP0329-20121206/11065_1 /TAXON_ID=697910 /ORGANISM="Pseudo-nitzschia arenysensis, Strain B593" /LENGTH=201 /DNA_ID=CAMNT_0003629987 /DNA_START=117 /DNA_END=722 /DNA_ORIENTATION=+